MPTLRGVLRIKDPAMCFNAVVTKGHGIPNHGSNSKFKRDYSVTGSNSECTFPICSTCVTPSTSMAEWVGFEPTVQRSPSVKACCRGSNIMAETAVRLELRSLWTKAAANLSPF
jgi:hypothetical protein